jgi:hypothetical protein
MLDKLRAWALLLALACFATGGTAAGTAAGADPAVQAFFGAYDGESMYPADEYGRRQLTVVISPYEETGFTVEWLTAMERARGDRQTNTDRLDFLPSATDPRVFRAVPADGGAPSTDPLDGQRYAWARLKDNILTVHVLTITPEGDYVMQTYDRALNEFGLTLSFVRVRNGTMEKRIWGSMYRRDR